MVEIIARDRAGAYAEGGKDGAPYAIQVAHRFHVSANASVALDDVLRSRQGRIEYVLVQQPDHFQNGPKPTAPVPAPSQTQQELAIRRSGRNAPWDQVRPKRAAGYSLQRIAREMGVHRRTISRCLATPEVPRNRPPERPRPPGFTSPTLQPFVTYLEGRETGCTKMAQLSAS
ncbi:MAG: helix-turn-helix domain-containing protein [Chloroflexi bacterium]|nr:helix-turn-helix domain-containing protein [Chloroflexota bacterium]